MNGNTGQSRAPAVVAEELSKLFRDFWRRPKVLAVDRVNLRIERGEVFGLLGPNGAGKSTTIKLILGLLRPTGGRIQVLGKPPDDVAAKARIGYMPEESYLYGYLTVKESLHFYGKLFGLRPEQRDDRIAQLLTALDLADAADRLVCELSKGMAGRLGLAQALINNPDLLVLDEPTAGLDPMGRRDVKDMIRALGRMGKTVLLTSHLLAEVEDVCDRIAILYGGSVKAAGRVRDLLDEPAGCTLTVHSADPGEIEKLRAALRAATGSEPELARPKRSLENCFLDVVSAAQGRTRADAAERIPDFLSSTGSGSGI